MAALLLADQATTRLLARAERVYAERLADALAALGRTPAVTYAG